MPQVGWKGHSCSTTEKLTFARFIGLVLGEMDRTNLQFLIWVVTIMLELGLGKNKAPLAMSLLPLNNEVVSLFKANLDQI